MFSTAKIFLICLVALQLFPRVLQAQGLEMQAEYGVLMPSMHKPSDSLLKRSSYQAAAIAFTWHGDTSRVYYKVHRNPIYGINFFACTFHNKLIGDPFMVSFFIKTSFYERPRFKLFYLVNSGLAWNFSVYDQRLNPHNWLIGTSVNFMGHVSVGFEYRVGSKFKIGGALGYRHFSNGSFKWPNYGINIIPFSLHAAIVFKENKSSAMKKQAPVFLPFHSFTLFCAPSGRGSSNGSNYLSSTLGALWIHQINFVLGLGGGLDIFYNASGKTKVAGNESDLQKMLSAGICASVNWMFTERFFINIGVGPYLWRHPSNDEHYPLYERIAARYLLTKNLLVGLGIKINGNASDYIEWTVGYVFKNDRNLYRQ